MGKWQAWEKIWDGPYQGTPGLSYPGELGLGGEDTVYAITVRDRAGNVIRRIPPMHGGKESAVNSGGAGIIAHLGIEAGGYLATGSDKCLYGMDIDYSWRKVGGPGRFLSAVYSSISMDAYAEILGEGTEHQLAYSFVTPEQNQNNTITQWEDLGQPGEPGGKKGLNGRPAVMYDVNDARGLHVLVRGQDNHLWHIYGKGREYTEKRSFGSWTNLGGGLTQVPVAISTPDGIECFVVGEKKELLVKTWDGKRWSGFVSLGGQLKGLPAAASVWGSDSTFVFGRGIHDQLWYRRRSGSNWQEWQSVGDQLTSDPAVWAGLTSNNGEGQVSCVVLRRNGELWERSYQFRISE